LRKIDGITYEEVYLDEEDGRYHYHCYTCSTSFSGPDEYKIMNKADEHERSHQETRQ
jgi:hypothetical protein